MKTFVPSLISAVIGFFLVSHFAYAGISVTEVAWMGTTSSANDEWIEIYNDGSASESLSGWTLSASDGTPAITLSGTIGAGEYKLLERTDDTTFPGITALVIFTGALGNEGESLALKDGGTTIQSLSYSGGWPAGDATTKHTMQWNGSSWITATESAGGPTTSSGGGEEEEDDETDDDTSEELASGELVEETERKIYDTMLLKIERPKMAIAGSPTLFQMEALNFDRTIMRRGEFNWNMGDGVVFSVMGGSDAGRDGFYHTYEHPGTYHVTVKYWKTDFEDTPPDLTDDFSVEVFEPTITITKVHPDGGIEIKNSSSREIDLSDWRIKDSLGGSWLVPEDTKLLAGKSFTFSKRATRLNAVNGVSIYTPASVLVAEFAIKPVVAKTISKSPSTNKAVSYKEKTVTLPKKDDGEVLGAAALAADTEATTKKDKNPNALVWVFAFVILILVAIVAVLLLKKDDKTDDEYELIDE